MSASPLRVLVVTSQLPPDIGGTSVYAAEMARGLQRAGHEVTVAIRDRDPAEFAALGLDVVPIDTRRGLLKPLRLRRARRAVVDLARARRADVVLIAYTVVGFGDVYGELRRAGIPYVVGVHGFNRSDLASAAAREGRRRKWGLDGAARVIACTRWLAETITPLAGRPVDFVHYGIDQGIDAFATPERVAAARARLGLDGRRVLLALGRYVPRKNFDGVLRALPGLCQRFPDLTLLLVGGGQEEENLRSLAAALGVADRVVWGARCAPHEVGVYYKLADLFVTVSRTREEDDTYETFGLVYAEANLCGVAVVGGREAGVVEAVEDGVTGLLVAPDDGQAMQDAMATLLGDEALRRRMAEAGRRRVLEHFTWDRAAAETAALLRAAAASRSTPV